MNHNEIVLALTAFTVGVLVTCFVYEIWMGNVAVEADVAIIQAKAAHPADEQPELSDIEQMLREKLGATEIEPLHQQMLDLAAKTGQTVVAVPAVETPLDVACQALVLNDLLLDDRGEN